MSIPAIQIENLTYRYRRTVAVDKLNLVVPEGSIFGFLGENGAGKTTTIRVLMGLLRPAAGSVRLLDMNPQGGNPALLQKVGYVSDDRAMYRSVRIRDILKFNAGLYEQWDKEYMKRFLNEFDLNPKKKIKNLSMGHLALVALLCAIAPRPRVLVLDEPCNGLDPIMRQKYLSELHRIREALGTTVFFSSHMVAEIDRIAGEVAILFQGRRLLQKDKEALRASLKRVVFEGPAGPSAEWEPPREWDWVLSSRRLGPQLQWVVRDFNEEKKTQLAQRFGVDVQLLEMSLEEVFSEYTLWAKANPQAVQSC